MDEIQLNMWTFAVASLMLAPCLFWERRTRTRLALGERRGTFVGRFIVLSTVGIIPPSIFLAWGIAHSSASDAAIISLVIPVLMAIMAVVMLGERMTVVRWLSFGVAIFGTLLISKIDLSRGSMKDGDLAGDAVILVAWLGSAFYNTYSKKLLGRFTELEVLTYGYLVALSECLFMHLIESHGTPINYGQYSFRVWGSILVLGGMSWGIAMVIWMWLLKRLDVSQVSISIYLLPLLGVLISSVTLHEKVSVHQIGGGVLVLVATTLTVASESRSARQANSSCG